MEDEMNDDVGSCLMTLPSNENGMSGGGAAYSGPVSSTTLPAADGGADIIGFVLAHAARTPLLSVEHEQQLVSHMQQGDEHARQQLIEANLRLVVFVAKRYLHAGLPFEDLVQEGTLGLMNALDHYRPARSMKLSTYAVFWIKQAILRALENTARIIRLPTYTHGQLRRIHQAREHLFDATATGETATTDEASMVQIAALTGLPPERVHLLCTLEQPLLSLERPVSGESEATLADLLPDPLSPSPEEAVSAQEEHHQGLSSPLQAALASLTERERAVVLLRFGFEEGGQTRTLAEVGRCLGICRERVRQLLEAALEKLRASTQVQALWQDEQQEPTTVPLAVPTMPQQKGPEHVCPPK